MLKGRKVEQNRIEYKEGFNSSDIVHTICAYANDIAGVDGGCLVICVKAENGLPVLPSIGLPSELLDDIQLKIFQYCNKIELRYIPKIDIVEYQGAYLVYLKCAAGDAGSYQALVDLYSKEESGKEQNRTMKYWIRPASLTTEAKQSELAELFEKFASIPFVDCINSWASMAHIRRGYLEDFIRESNSSLIEKLNVRLLKDLMEKFAAGKVRARRYRNPKIGEFFKEIDLSEKKSTGISKILRELKRNDSPLPEFETDADRTYMITTIKIHEGFHFGNFAQKNERSLSEVLSEV